MLRLSRRWQVAIGVCLGFWLAAAPQSPIQGQQQSSSEADDPFSELEVISPVERTEPAAGEICRCLGEAEGRATRRIQKTLRGPLTSAGFDFTDTPLEEVLNFLQVEYQIPIQLDLRALEAIGLQPDEPVNITVQNVSLRSGLRLMLRHSQLAYIIRDEVLVITSSEAAEQHLSVCVYDMVEIVDVTKAKEVRQLVDAVESCIAMDTWASNGGGEADIKVLPSGLLVVCQTQDIQEEIRELLILLKKMRPALPAGNTPTGSDRRNQGADADGDPFAEGPPNDSQRPKQTRTEGGGFFRPAEPSGR